MIKHFLIILALAILSVPGRAYERLQGPTELIYWNKTQTYDGYTFFGAQGTTYLIDMEGRVVHTWPVGTNPRLLDNGHVLDVTNSTTFVELDWNGSNVWSYTESRTNYFPHGDFLRIYNPKLGTNTTLYIANKSITSNECIAAGCNPASAPYTNVTVDAIVEVNASGTVVWEWCFFDHGVQNFDAGKANYTAIISNAPGRINLNLPGRPLTNDWLHCVSIDYNQTLDQIVIAAEGGEFYVIDHGNTFSNGNPTASIALAAGTAGDFRYRFGDPARYGAGDPPSVQLNWTKSSTGHKQIGGVSQVTWIPTNAPGAGRFLVFNNGQDLFETTPQSYLFEVNGYLNSATNDTGAYVNPPLAGYNSWSAPGHDTDKEKKNISRQVVSIYFSMANQAFFSHIGGSAQRLPNSNTLVCASAEGHIFEMTPATNVVWEYICPITTNGIVAYKRDNWPLYNPVYRAMRYSATHPAFAGRTLTGSNTIASTAPLYISAPTISGTTQSPSAPTSTNIVTVTATITNSQGVASATLSYIVGATTNAVAMSHTGSLYSATIPTYASGTLVRYFVSAQDDFDNVAADTLRSYTVLTGQPPAISNVTLTEGWITARVTDDVSVASVTLNYSTGVGATVTNTVFLETMATNAVKPWTGTGCDNMWTVTGSSYFEQRAGSNYGGGNTNGMQFKQGTANLTNSMIATTLGIAATGSTGYVEFYLGAIGLTNATAGWTFQLNPGTGYVTRASELTASNHNFQLYHYDLQSSELVTNLLMRFQFMGGSTEERVNLDYISVKSIISGSSWTNAVMYDDGLHGDGTAGDGIYGAQLPSQATSYYIVATDGGGNSATDTTNSYVALNEPNLVIGRPTASAITLNALADTNLLAYIEYGTQSVSYASETTPTNLLANVPIELDLTSLVANTRYYYRLNYKLASESVYHTGTQHTFMTQRASGSTFSFSIQGDSHPEREGSMFNPALYARTLLTAAADQPDFYLTIGDDFSVDNIATNLINQALVTERYTIQRPYLGIIGSSAPLFLVNGNHEQAALYLLDGTPSNIAVWAQTARNKYYPQPAPDSFYTGNTNVVPYIGQLRNYFAWTWGDALFVTIDPYWESPTCPDNNYWTGEKRTNLWDVTHGDVQYQWLKKTLEESTAKYKFVFAHHVMGTGRGGVEDALYYEWGGQNLNGTWGFATNRPTWSLPIHQLMATNHVTIFFQGHDHLFAHQQLDGVTYLTLPNPADDTYAFWNSTAFTNNVTYKTNNTGYVRVTVDSAKVKVDYVRTFLPADEGLGKTNGMVDYSFALSAFAITNVTASPALPAPSNTVWVSAALTTTNVTQVTLTYNAGAGPVNVTMINSSNALFGGQIPAFPAGTNVNYYVTAQDSIGRTATYPAGAPSNTLSYTVYQSVIASGGVLTQLVAGLHFTEGPVADSAGNIYFSDVTGDAIYKWSVANQLSMFRTNSAGANGLDFDRFGNLLACEGDTGQLVLITPQTNVVALASTYGGLRFNEPNDLWIDPLGGVYFTDPVYFGYSVVQGGEYVYYLKPDRSAVIRVVTDMVRPNGLVGTADGTTLYIADWGASTVYRYSVNSDGTLSNKTAFASVRCDGMTMDTVGNLYLTETAIRVFTPAGVEVEQISIAERPTNLAFGGSDRKTLFITTDAGSLYSLSMRTQGAPLDALTNQPPVIASVGTSPAAPYTGNPTWIMATVTDDVGVAAVMLTYNTGASASVTNTVFLETMATNAVKPWTGTGCNNSWSVTGTNYFEQRVGSNYGGGNTNGMQFKQGTLNLTNSMIATTLGIAATGSTGYVEFYLGTTGLTVTNTGWTFQLNAGTGYVTRLSELSGTNHAFQLYHYDLQPTELVTNLMMRFQFAGISTNDRVNLDQISVKTITGGGTIWTNVTMSLVSNGVYSAQIPAQAIGTTVSYYITATDIVGATTNNPAGGAGSALSFVVASSAAVPFDVLLGRPTGSSIAVSVLPSADVQLYCQYGTQSNSYPNQTAVTNLAAGTPGVLTLTSLLADTQYYYRLCYRLTGETNYTAAVARTFHTQRATDSSFTFEIEADPHWKDPNASISPALWQVALTNMLADNPDFLIDLGDTFLTEKLGMTNYAGAAQLCLEVRTNIFGLVGHSVPLFLVNGNHEAELGWLNDGTTNNPAVWATQTRQLYYPCPAADAFYSGSASRDGYYAFHWGNALFVVLDPFWLTAPKPGPTTGWNWTLGTNQYAWLQQTLSKSTAAFKFVFIHNLVGGDFSGEARGGIEVAPYFEWGGLNTNGVSGFATNRTGWAMPIHDLLVTNRVNAVFHGHDHLFVRQELNGIVYQECPQPSATNYNTTSTALAYGYTNGVVQGNSGHLRVRMTPTLATFEYVRAYLPGDEGSGKTNAMVTYSYTIAPSLAITGTALSVTSPTPTNIVTVSATVLTTTNISQAALYYIVGGATNSVAMTNAGAVYNAQIPAFAAGTTVSYYLRIQDILGRVLTDPVSGPYTYTVSALANYWSMLALPDTGQTITYTSTFGEDSDYAIHPPAYVNNGNGTISDKVTGLMWQQTDGGEMTWESASTYASTNNAGGYTDWRLPTAHELYSISKQGAVNPAINTNYFPVTLAEYWWSRDVQVGNATNIWVANAGGGIGNHPKTETMSAGGTKRFHVRCVRGATAPSTNSPIHHFTNNGNGTITDTDTGLIWQQAEISTPTNWAGALAYAASNSLAGYTDWRLPNIKELQSINDETLVSPSVDTAYFTGATASRYWSSTSMHNSTNEAWYLDCQYGVTSYALKTTNLFVRCVRGGTTNITSSFTAQFVRIPGGNFVMGDHFNYIDPEHPSDERPLHNVYISPLYMDTTLVTVREYCDYLNAARYQGLIEVRSNVVYAVGGTNDYFYTYGTSVYSRVEFTNNIFVVRDNRDTHPITSVRWFGAIAYCNWLSQRGKFKPCYNLDTGDVSFTNNGFRLPTEAEWEYAAVGGQTNPYCMFPWGTNSNASGTYANWEGSGDPFETGAYPYTTPVGFYNGSLRYKDDYNWPGSVFSYQTSDGSNPYGLYDMAGNVWEWVNDWYMNTYYTNCVINNIVTNPPGPATGDVFVAYGNLPYRNLRGGTWYNGGGQTNFGFSRVSNRDPSWSLGPAIDSNPATLWFQVGFRVMRPDKAATTVGLILNTTNAFPGYTLISPMHSTNTYLINNAGQVVHKWTSSYEPGRADYLLENGHLMRACMVTSGGPSTGGGEGGRIEERDWAGNLVWAIDYYSSSYIHHHDFKVLPNGNVLLLVAEKKTYAEVIAAGFNPSLLDSSITNQGYMLPDCLVEVKPTRPYGGTVVWEWHLWDHMIQDFDTNKNNYGVVADHPELIDVNGPGIKIPQFWNHVNGIDYNAQLDQVMLSIRGNSELFVIDHQLTTAQAAGHTGGRYGKGGDILYRWGYAKQYDRSAASPQMLYQQHHTHWIATNCPGAGNILIFNNGIGRGYSTINEIVPPVDAAGNYALTTGAAYGPASNYWLYAASPTTNFYSSEISGAQRLPNGNTLICAGIFGDLFEVTTNGTIVWRYICPETDAPLAQGSTVPSDPARPDQLLNAVFRVNRYPTNYVGLAGKDLTPRGTIETYTGAATDTDGDGLPDIWERQLFGSLSTANGATDYDNDGLSTVLEYRYGTIPTQWSSPTNGIPDGWAVAYSFDPTLYSVASLTGSNGYTILQNYLADLNPTNAASRLAVTSLSIVGTNVHITWIGGNNATQYLEYCENLTSNQWRAFFTNAPPTAITNFHEHTGAVAATNLFYRINAHR